MKLTKQKLKQIIKEEYRKISEVGSGGTGEAISTAFGGMLGDLRTSLSKNRRMAAAAAEIEKRGQWEEYEAMAQQVSRDRPDKFLEPQIYIDHTAHFRKLYPELVK